MQSLVNELPLKKKVNATFVFVKNIQSLMYIINV